MMEGPVTKESMAVIVVGAMAYTPRRKHYLKAKIAGQISEVINRVETIAVTLI